MFEQFLGKFTLTPPHEREGVVVPAPALERASGYAEFMSEFAGRTFGNGIYRVHNNRTASAAAEWISDAFAGFGPRSLPFAFDWMGRQFALDSQRRVDDELQILMFEPATGTALEVPFSFASFHDEELAQFGDDVLASEFFSAWAAREPSALPLAFDECVGYVVPLFLGGADAVENLEVTDIEVYWSLSAQLWNQVSRLPDGTPISRVNGDQRR